MITDAQETLYIFAYGSNMLSARLIARCPSARPLGVAELPGYELRWHKRSRDQSGKCDVVRTSGDSKVFGVVYEIDAKEKEALDKAEGLGHGYEQMCESVILNERNRTVTMYVATDTDPSLKPYTWYKALVVAGANEHRLPAPYIANLEAVEALEDAERSRHDRNMRIVSTVGHIDGNRT